MISTFLKEMNFDILFQSFHRRQSYNATKTYVSTGCSKIRKNTLRRENNKILINKKNSEWHYV